MSNIEYDLLVQGFAAFAGAFFAFLFLRVAEFFTKLYQRQVKHYNSLVNLEVQLNEIGGIISDNIYILPKFREVIASGNIYFNNLHLLPIDKSHYENLYDLDLMNRVYTYNYGLRKINDDMQTATQGYLDIKDALIQQNINKKDYVINASLMADQLFLIEVFLKELQNETVELQARVRVQMRGDKPLGTRIQQFFIHSVGPKIKQDELDEEIKKLKSELKETGEKSRKEIDDVLKKHNLERIK